MSIGSYYNISVNSSELDNPIFGDNISGLLSDLDIHFEIDEEGVATFANNGSQNASVEVPVSDADNFREQLTTNPTVVFSQEDNGRYGKVNFCLAPTGE